MLQPLSLEQPKQANLLTLRTQLLEKVFAIDVSLSFYDPIYGVKARMLS